ncbi:RDD family protein [Phycicoccus sp. CSK15P-2]|uniref:RDD family protein n=1 Tax=Phycicoccus sp. CSK15P-2 TaxID=2807627 RepID=UPI00195172AD|nr:RDD family protein [Phycicoccus sp. CSK15P-2]MBM6404337.1 RDD family protein [Phycicoccus sp. CSK15P-2]
MSEPTTPGWYPDPEDADQLRYFDGIVWTAHRTPLRSPTAGASTIGRAPEVPDPAVSARAHGGTAQPGAGPAGYPWQQAPAGATTDDGAPLAEWWRRLLGRLVDLFLTNIVAGLLSLPFLTDYLEAFEGYLQAVLRGESPDVTPLQNALEGAVLPVTLIGLAVSLLYETAFLVWRAATPGKMLLGTVVRPADAPGRISWGVAMRRQAIRVLTGLSALNPVLNLLGRVLWVVDPAWLLYDPKRQTLHDKVAETVVVRR